MKKYTKILFLLNLLLLLAVSCKKKVIGTDYKDFPNGRYTGVFVFDTNSTLPISVTKMYVGTKEKVLTNNNKDYQTVFNFFQISQFDSTQLGISIYNDIAHVGSNLIHYDINIKGNIINAVQYGSSDSTYYNTLTLTYTP